MKKLNLLIGVFVLIFISYKHCFSQEFYESAFKLGKVIEYIDKYYVDSVDNADLVEDAIRDMLNNLDPHSSYISSKEVKDMNEPLQGNFEGIGISFNILNDTILVVSPISGGPSEKVGIQAGDRIVRVDKKNVAGTGITTNDVFRLLRGQKGTRVDVSVLRKNVKGLLEFTIIRDKIPIYSVDAAYILDESTGYIKVNRFSLTTIGEFNEALQKFKDAKINNLILDLSGNGGGYLEVAFELADEFLDSKRLIVYTEGRNSPKREYFASEKGGFETGNLVVIIDEGSASASEIVAGAIQDWDRGIIIGRRSFGKGLVQKPLMLPDQSEIRLTVARYYTPTGRLIQKPYDNKDNYDMDIINRYNNGELMHKDSIHFPDSLKYHTLVKSRVVYGGGGIMPDIFIPIDTSHYSDFYRDLVRQGILNQFILTYVDKNRKLLQADYPVFSDFKSGYSITPEIFKQLMDYAKSQDLIPGQNDISVSEEQIKLLMKAYIARDLWSSSEFYEIVNTTDPKIKKAVEVLENWKNYLSVLSKPK